VPSASSPIGLPFFTQCVTSRITRPKRTRSMGLPVFVKRVWSIGWEPWKVSRGGTKGMICGGTGG
jgi:hypothetical protein